MAGSRLPQLVPLFGAPTHTPSKNRVMGVTLAFGGHCFMIRHHNQPDSWQSARGGARGKVCGGWERVGGRRPIIWTFESIDEKIPNI